VVGVVVALFALAFQLGEPLLALTHGVGSPATTSDSETKWVAAPLEAGRAAPLHDADSCPVCQHLACAHPIHPARVAAAIDRTPTFPSDVPGIDREAPQPLAYASDFPRAPPALA
jgi:hypothetical protein